MNPQIQQEIKDLLSKIYSLLLYDIKVRNNIEAIPEYEITEDFEMRQTPRLL
jgi:hypothetical protein